MVASFIATHTGDILRDQTDRELVYRPFEFQKRSKDIVGADDETLSVAMRVHNPDCSSVGIHD